MYRNADPEELASLHPSDRLMVQLLKINRLAPRIEGMLYKCVFDETWGLLDDVRARYHCSVSSLPNFNTECTEVVTSRQGAPGRQKFQGAAQRELSRTRPIESSG